jgi:hypothetical protein
MKISDFPRLSLRRVIKNHIIKQKIRINNTHKEYIIESNKQQNNFFKPLYREVVPKLGNSSEKLNYVIYKRKIWMYKDKSGLKEPEMFLGLWKIDKFVFDGGSSCTAWNQNAHNRSITLNLKGGEIFKLEKKLKILRKKEENACGEFERFTWEYQAVLEQYGENNNRNFPGSGAEERTKTAMEIFLNVKQHRICVEKKLHELKTSA